MISESIHPARSQPAERGITIPIGRYWERPALALILLLSALLELYGLSREGYANSYYAAAVKSMMQNWHAFFFNSFDPGGFVTIDKPPLGFWLQVASAKLFGFSGVSLLLPQALATVLSVAVLYHLVARTFGRVAGIIAALALAVSPISVVTGRNNTIDSTLVLAVLLGAWAALKAGETGRLRWLLLSALAVGLGFDIKMLEAYLVVPAFGLVYLLGARTGLRRRLGHLALAAVALLGVSLSWVTAVDLTPASQRPWVGSTSTNSELDLAIGYNGLQRLLGNQRAPGGSAAGRPSGPAGAGSTSSFSISGAGQSASSTSRPTFGIQGGGPPGGGNGGPGGVGENGTPGPLRLLNTQLGAQIGWLLLLAAIGFCVALWRTRPRLRQLDDRQRSLVLWGGWLLTTGVFFSIANYWHTYYLVMVAPAICALTGIGIVALWDAFRSQGRSGWLLPLTLLAAAGVQAHILTDYPSWARWLTPLVAGGCVLAALLLVAARLRPRSLRRAALPAAVIGVVALLAAPTAWASYSTANAMGTGLPTAGPGSVNRGIGGFGGFGPHGGSFAPPAGFAPGGAASGSPASGAPGGSGAVVPGAPGDSSSSTFGTPPQGFAPPAGSGGPPGSFTPGASGGPGGFRGPGGQGTVNQALLRYLEQHRGNATFLVATPNANSAAPFILATGQPVMALGGFLGSDPILTPAKLAALVKAGTVRFFLLDGFGGPGGGTSTLTSWVQTHCSSVPASKYSSGTATSGFDGGGSLYVCRSVAA